MARRNIPALMIGVCACMLSACLYEPSHMNASKVEVVEEPYSNTIPVSQFSSAAVEQAANHYSKHGDGPLELVVTYDPKSSRAGAMQATDEASRLAKLFREQGVSDIKTNIMPVNDGSEEMRAMLSYNAYNAQAPADCGMLPGMTDRQVEADQDYKIGCSIETMYARQVARPKDLMGQELDPNADGRRAANIVETYRTGQPNKPLQGESASGD